MGLLRLVSLLLACASCTPILDIDGFVYVETGGAGGSGGAPAGGAGGEAGEGGEGGHGGEGGEGGEGGHGGHGGEGGEGGSGGTILCGNGSIDDGETCDGENLGGATCASLGLAGGDIACSDCTITGCVDHFADGFEAAVLAGHWTFAGGAWLVSTNAPHGGVQSAASANIGHDEETAMQLSLRYEQAGSVSFWHRESTELCCDFLVFDIDGEELGWWDGINGWSQSTFPVPVGDHVLTWRYTRDAADSAGDDKVWLDDITTVNGYLVP